MSQFNRYLWTGLVLGLAACGDDVTVTNPPEPPPPPVPGVTAVSVAPDGATIIVGAKLGMTAAATLQPGAAAPTWAWSSSSNSIATVAGTTASAEVTAVAAGSAGIRATATVGTSSASGVATVNVTTSTVTPPTVSINSVLQGQSATCSATPPVVPGGPVDLANAACQLDVVLNFERNSTKIDSLVLQVDGKTVAKQAFSASAPFEGEAASPELAIENATLSFNTAKYNSTTGAVDFFNGSHVVQSKIYYPGATSGPAASNTITVNFNNTSGWATTISVTNGSSANNATTGYQWWTGDLEATTIPVVYVPGTITVNSMTFSGCGGLTKTLTAAPYKYTWPKASTPANGGSAGVEQDPCQISVASVVNNNPGPGNLFTGGSNTIRFDNKGPGAPTFIANPNGRQNGWINATVGLTGENEDPNTFGQQPLATDNDWLYNGTADGGVGGYVRYLRIGDDFASAVAAAASATPALPAPTLTNAGKCAVASARDLLGNESTLPTAGPCNPPQVVSLVNTGLSHQQFGVDIAPPTVAYTAGSLADVGRLQAWAGEFIVTVADTGTIGNSGMLAGTPLRSNVVRRNVAGTSCVQGSGSSCSQTATGLTVTLPTVTTNLVTTVGVGLPAFVYGYLTHGGTAYDAAGNSTAIAAGRTIVYDGTVPALTSALYNTPLTGGQVVFNANASDNLDLWKATYTLTFAGGLAGPVRLPDVILNTFNAATLQYSNVPAGITIPNFVRQVENVTSTTLVPLAVGGQFKPTQLDGFVTDQANNASLTATTLIAPASVTTGVSYVGAPAAQQVYSWAISNAATNISGGFPSTTPANPLSVTLNADVFGPTATFNPPFARVDFYVFCVAGGAPANTCTPGQLYQVGTTTSVSTLDNGAANGRRHRYSFSWTPGTSFGGGVAAQLYAVGVNAAGDALVTLVNPNITITNP